MPKKVNILDRPPPRYFTAWSYSRWADHAECPRRARLKHLDKVPESAEKSPALVRGDTIHKLAEKYVKGEVARLPAELKSFTDEFKTLRKIKATAEGKWGLTLKWEPSDFFDWDRTWLRVVLDAHHPVGTDRVKVIDYKTGKVYGTNAEQLELYALAGFAHYPDVKVVETELWYLDQGEILPADEDARTFTIKQVPKLQKKWRERVIPLLRDKKFVPRPGPHCHRCAYSKKKGGPCEFGG